MKKRPMPAWATPSQEGQRQRQDEKEEGRGRRGRGRARGGREDRIPKRSRTSGPVNDEAGAKAGADDGREAARVDDADDDVDGVDGVEDVEDHYGKCETDGCTHTAYFENGGYLCGGGHVICGRCMGEHLHRLASPPPPPTERPTAWPTERPTAWPRCPAADENAPAGSCARPLSHFDLHRVLQSLPPDQGATRRCFQSLIARLGATHAYLLRFHY